VTPLRLGALAWPVGRPTNVAAFAERVDGWLRQARGQADLCLLPEYAVMELGAGLGAAPGDARAELAAVAAAAPALVDALRGLAIRHGLWLLPGTLPMAQDGTVRNRAPLIAPDGRIAWQDKLAMTRFEAEAWGILPGAGPAVFETPWGRLGVSICYDAEFPKHVRAQVEAGAWLVLVPTCTDTMQGFNRVRIAARARALENQCFVAVAPTVGAAPWSAALDQNHGFAAIFGPIDRGFPEDGVIARGTRDAPGWVFAALDAERIARVRRDGAVLNHHDWPRAPVAMPQPARFQ
jgi:predicted amidohydrolase